MGKRVPNDGEDSEFDPREEQSKKEKAGRKKCSFVVGRRGQSEPLRRDRAAGEELEPLRRGGAAGAERARMASA